MNESKLYCSASWPSSSTIPPLSSEIKVSQGKGMTVKVSFSSQ